eukprot:5892279-Pleurochrysis_carterae.AAC.1
MRRARRVVSSSHTQSAVLSRCQSGGRKIRPSRLGSRACRLVPSPRIDASGTHRPRRALLFGREDAATKLAAVSDALSCHG